MLPLLPLMGGCKALVREAEAVTYRPGTTPAITTVKTDATYTLYAPAPLTQLGYATIDLTKGATVGFRRELDGSLVAVAGAQTTPIPDDRAVWRYTPQPVTGLDRFAVSTRDKCEHAAGAVASVLFLPPFILWQVMTGGEVP